jgi:protein gp37
MSANSKIEWTDHTHNPWIGCTKVSPACDHCYAAVSTPARAMHVEWGAGQPRHRTSEANRKEPLRWNANHDKFFAEHGRRQRVFCASLADVFDNEVPTAWRTELFEIIASTPHLDWLLLTKRIGNTPSMIMDALQGMFLRSNVEPPTWPWPNVWLGASIVNQEEADRDIPKLLQVPAAKQFLSMEPLLGPVDLSIPLGLKLGWDKEDKPFWWPNHLPQIDWVIVGGESGTHARPMHPDWARSLRDQCAVAGVPFLFKQLGEWVQLTAGVPAFNATAEFDDGLVMARVGKKAAGRLLDGRTHDEFPKGQA